MRAFLFAWRTVLLTLALVLLAEGIARVPAVQRLFDPADGSVYAARWRHAYAAQTPDVLLLGDSRNVMDLSPRALAEGVARNGDEPPVIINLAAHGSSMEQIYLFLKNVALSQPARPVMVLNVSEVALNDAAWAESAPLYLRALQAPLSFTSWSTGEGRAALLESLSRLMSLQHRLRLTVEERWPNYLRGAESYDAGAMVWRGQMSAEERDKQLVEYRDRFLVGFDPAGEQGRFFEQILAEARANGLRLILVISPVTQDFLDAYPAPGDAARFTAYVKDRAARYGIPVFDYYRTPALSDDQYFDLHHINASGTEQFSAIVADEALRPALDDWQAFVERHVPTSAADGEPAP